MIEQLFLTAAARKRLLIGPLAPHLEGLALCLASQGFARCSAKHKLRLVAALSAWLQRKRLPVSALNEALIDQFLNYRRRSHVVCGGGSTGKLLLNYLRDLGAIPPPAKAIDDSALTWRDGVSRYGGCFIKTQACPDAGS